MVFPDMTTFLSRLAAFLHRLRTCFRTQHRPPTPAEQQLRTRIVELLHERAALAFRLKVYVEGQLEIGNTVLVVLPRAVLLAAPRVSIHTAENEPSAMMDLKTAYHKFRAMVAAA
jgi:hypothetical protein